MNIEAYLPIALFALLVTLFGVASVLISGVVAPHNPHPAKLTPYESGIVPEPGSTPQRFPVRFYVIAMLFIVFDIETVFLYPWAVVFRRLGVEGLIEMGVFAAMLFAAYIYVWKRGGLDWES